MKAAAAVFFGAIALSGCSSSSPDESTNVQMDGSIADASDADFAADAGAIVDAAPAIRSDRFVVGATLEAGACAGYGATGLPGVVQGAPLGGGDEQGSLDVVSLGTKGSIVLSFGTNAIVDGPGVDFIVFENAFLTGGVPDFELGEVSVSEDGTTWETFPCTATGVSPDGGYGDCAGWRPDLSNPDNGISPVDPKVAGGDQYDLKDVGLTQAKYVRIVDTGVDYFSETCPAGSTVETDGFDLDAVSIVNALAE